MLRFHPGSIILLAYIICQNFNIDNFGKSKHKSAGNKPQVNTKNNNGINMIRLFSIITALFACISCNTKSEEVSVEKFREYVSIPMGTVRYSEYQGVQDGRAYISVYESAPLGNWDVITYWVKASKLTSNELSTLEAARAK